MQPDRRRLSAREAAAITGLPLSTLYLYAERRIIPSLRIGSRVLFPPRADLEDWLERRTAGGNAVEMPKIVRMGDEAERRWSLAEARRRKTAPAQATSTTPVGGTARGARGHKRVARAV